MSVKVTKKTLGGAILNFLSFSTCAPILLTTFKSLVITEYKKSGHLSVFLLLKKLSIASEKLCGT